MTKLIYFDFSCEHCGHDFDELVEPEVREATCPNCRKQASRRVSLGHLDWRMGASKDFPTMATKWDKMQRQKSKVDKGGRADGAPNLKMY